MSGFRFAGATRFISEALERRVHLAAHPTLVKDVNQTTDMLNPGNLTVSGGVGYFTGQNSALDGVELWKTDGTTAGTVQVKDINPGRGTSTPSNLTDVNGTLFFIATDPTNGTELWKSDGTEAGTVLVKNIASGTSNSNPANLTNVNGTLYFSATDIASGVLLWKSDGTAAGTVKVSSTATSPNNLVNLNGTLIFSAISGGDRELWKSDGTSVGTVVLANINSTGSSTPTSLTVWNNAVYFNADPTSTSRGDLYRTDGTTTTVVKQINLDASDNTRLLTFTPSGSSMYFMALNVPLGTYQLWRSDGTNAGTIPLLTSTPFNTLTRFQAIGTNSLLFSNSSGAAGNELWVSNGTVAGTTILKDILPGTASGFTTATGASPHFVRVGSTAFLNASKADGNQELWKSDGTAAGTVRVSDALGGMPALVLLGSINSSLLFTGFRFIGLGDLYKSDGTAAGTVRLGANAFGNGTSFSSVTVSNYAGAFFRDGETMYFTANDGINGNELWKTSGATTTRVTDIEVGAGSSDPAELVKTDDGTIYFSAATLANGRELYKLSTSGVVQRVSDVATGALSTDPRFTSPVGNLVYFNGKDSSGGISLYRYDPGTSLVTQALSNTGVTLQSPSKFTKTTLYSYFTASTSSQGNELWRTDGTQAGTQLVQDINPGSSNSFASSLCAVGSVLYFAATDSTHGSELWSTNGSTTSLITDMTAGSGSTNLSDLYWDGSRLLFAGGLNNSSTQTLWSLSGSTATQISSQITSPRLFQNDSATTYFIGSDTAGGGVFGLVGNTVTRLFGGTAATITSPAALYVVNSKLHVIGRTGPSSDHFEMWRSNGVAGDQIKITDLQPYVNTLVDGTYWLFGRMAVGFNSTHLYFPQYNAATGIEPHRLPLFDPTGSISGNVFDDVNRNGTRDIADAGLAGVTVYLDMDANSKLNGEEPTAITDGNGNFSFPEMEDGSYAVRVVIPAGRRQTKPVTAVAFGATISGGAPVNNAIFGLTIDAPPLRAAGAFTLSGSPTITIAFNDDVQANLSGSALQIVLKGENGNPDSTVTPSDLSFSTSGGSGNPTTATWVTKSLVNGNYVVTLPKTSVTSSAGNLSDDFTMSFFILAADGDRTRKVDIADFNVLATNFGKTGKTFAEGNYDYSTDGKITIEDFNILATNFGKHVDPLTGGRQAAAQAKMGVIGEVTLTGAKQGWLNQEIEDTNLLSDSGLI